MRIGATAFGDIKDYRFGRTKELVVEGTKASAGESSARIADINGNPVSVLPNAQISKILHPEESLTTP